ncbi:L,D-transpeptidase scaffold domain-containing protein [Hymenobacter psychrophilus]|uniref:Murein L,D-transpeptidase YcbB/YkuD n=1 Tax=Hymenobacter psychrophilus TaxID=651662 RepID=A0A1H3K7V2_9BACT|nr:L,D-transpeptidase family protein [Hymenobacter psychrophilus]SDY47678.1 Murein L,D-transpeptidase YcbB/YkuD [Hymenobacter psychrophilus]
MRLSSLLLFVLVLPWCGAHSTSRKPEASAPFVTPVPAAAVPVLPLVRALLDTATAGSARAADVRRHLQAGPEVRALYDSATAPYWTQPADSLNDLARAALALLARAPEHGLQPAYYQLAGLQALRDSLRQPASPAHRAGQQARLEVALSDAVLRFMWDLHRGRLRPYTASATEKAAGRVWQPAAVLRAGLAQGQVVAAMLAGRPTGREYRHLQAALARWLHTLPAQPQPGSAARRRQYEQAAVNLERWRWNPLPPDSAYLYLNIPAYELLALEGDSVTRRHRVIVGAPRTPTPTLSSVVRHFTLAPDWHVPRSIATREMLPRIRRDVGYLARNNYAVYDARGHLLDPAAINWRQVTAANFRYYIRQSAGCDNALGNVVFRFVNPYSVYLHDTPMRQYFARPDRALSHGCMRLAEPLQLAAYLLRRGGQPVRLPSEEECARQPRPRQVALRRPMPLHVRYATCQAAGDSLQFLADIYQLDAPLRRALFN